MLGSRYSLARIVAAGRKHEEQYEEEWQELIAHNGSLPYCVSTHVMLIFCMKCNIEEIGCRGEVPQPLALHHFL